MTTYSLNADILSGGGWVRRGLVWHWVATEPEPDIKEQPDYFPADLIACPVCLAKMDERCKGSSRERDHKRRLVKRVCSCGGPLRPQEPMCGFCRAEMTIREAA